MSAQLIPLSTWAELVFGEHSPHRHTLRNWINSGKIRPMPIKVGRSYFCRPDAQYVDPVADQVNREFERMANGR
ncbi:excisionase [Burkholderia cenocepacia]|uniref:excisionase n=1 Tax=Burkholderia cenocepacia TaxID=95486 RepID=UPI002AB65BE4|nr:excisionase [Burkholderia cenocepacia]